MFLRYQHLNDKDCFSELVLADSLPDTRQDLTGLFSEKPQSGEVTVGETMYIYIYIYRNVWYYDHTGNLLIILQAQTLTKIYNTQIKSKDVFCDIL